MKRLLMNLYPGYTGLVIPPTDPPICLIFNDEIIPAPEAIWLDTGLACDMIIPFAHLPALLAPDIIASATPQKFRGWGGELRDARAFSAQLVLHHQTWMFNVDVVFSADFHEWYIGLPILRHFDLLLADPEPFALPYIARPCLAGRDILP